MSRSLLCHLALAACVLVPRAYGQPVKGLGSVRFETSCAAATRQPFVRGVAHLHSFDFGDAVRSFNEVLAADSTCIIAHWGLALTAWNVSYVD